MIKKLSYLILLFAFFAGAAHTQKTGSPWTEWSKKDAEKILNDSAWGQTQTIGGDQTTSTSTITRTQGGGSESISREGQSGQTLGGSPVINFRARFLTAKPVREAF